MNKIWSLCVLGILSLIISCSKDKDDEGFDKDDIIGTWVATSGNYDLSIEISSTDYYFTITQPGKGGSYDKGDYIISDDGIVTFVNTSNTILATGQLRNGRLSLTFVSSFAIIMLGTEAASNVIFTLSEDYTGSGGDEGEGYLVIQNLSNNNNIVRLDFYDGNNNFIDYDDDILPPGYQFAYEEVEAGSYIVKATDDNGKSYTSKSFKIIKNKATVLEYTGSALNVTATGIDYSEVSRAIINSKRIGVK